MTISSNQPSSRPNAAAIQNWLLENLATMLNVGVQQIDVNEPLLHYGLDSVETITLAGDLSDFIGRNLPPTLVWDYPTIAAIANYLGSEAGSDAV